MKARYSVLATAMVFAAGAGAQGPMEPPGEVKKLDWMIGEWTSTVKWTYMMETDVPYAVKCEWEGQFLKVTSKMELMEMAFLETAYYGWDAGAKKYRGWIFTNFSPNPRLETGSLTGDQFVMTSDPWDVGSEEPAVGRATLTRKSVTEIHMLLEFKEGDKWVKGAEGTFKKKT